MTTNKENMTILKNVLKKNYKHFEIKYEAVHNFQKKEYF